MRGGGGRLATALSDVGKMKREISCRGSRFHQDENQHFFEYNFSSPNLSDLYIIGKQILY